MYANEFKTKEKQKLTEIKNELQHTYALLFLLRLLVAGDLPQTQYTLLYFLV